ncbi:MAG: putative ribonuclease [Thermoleophilia bacterium]|nr:putative ribonuclease [Thermoleophilia bacterium]
MKRGSGLRFGSGFGFGFGRRRVTHAPRLSGLRQLGNVTFLKRLASGVGRLHLTAFAAALAYGAVFAIVPLIAVLVSLLGVFNATDLVARAIDELGGVVPSDVLSLLDTQLTQVAQSRHSGALGLGAIVGVLIAIWGVSGAMRRIMEALNVVEGSDPDPRGFVKRYALSLALAIGAVLLIVCALLVIVVGGSVADRIFGIVGLSDTAVTVWSIARWPTFLALALVGVGLLYRYGAGTRTYGNVITPGAVFGTIGWVAITAAFSFYLRLAGSFDAAWGAVAGVIVFLLYAQYTGLILLLGALLDAELRDQ